MRFMKNFSFEGSFLLDVLIQFSLLDSELKLNSLEHK